MSSKEFVLEGRRITKAFSGKPANDNVDFAVRAGEIHALLGENGAGKSTLAAILTGLYRQDSGVVLVRGARAEMRSPRDGLMHKVGMVHQHLRLVERFTVAENVILGSPDLGRLLPKRLNADVARVGERYGLEIDPRALVANLSLGERQRVEIVKMLHRSVDVLFLDEPTAVLTPQESASLFDSLRAMAKTGKSIILITHKLSEVLELANRVTVMRDGRVVRTADRDQIDSSKLARLMVGRDIDLRRMQSKSSKGAKVLEASGLSLPEREGSTDAEISLAVCSGEIVGLAGISGNGQVELAEMLAGIRGPGSGKLNVCGTDVTGRGTRAVRSAGLAYVPQDRLGTGLAPSLSIAENLQLTRPKGIFYSPFSAERDAVEVIEDFDVKCEGPLMVTSRMSGGNVQKILLARELLSGASALVVASPTRGLDISAIEVIRDLLDERRSSGCGVLLISEDLDEILSLADRILVMFRGEIVLEQSGPEFDVTEIGLAMAGSRSEP